MNNKKYTKGELFEGTPAEKAMALEKGDVFISETSIIYYDARCETPFRIKHAYLDVSVLIGPYWTMKWYHAIEEKKEFPIKFQEDVLVRDGNNKIWRWQKFGKIINYQLYPFLCLGNNYSFIIPLKGNEHLHGTTDDCEDQWDYDRLKKEGYV